MSAAQMHPAMPRGLPAGGEAATQAMLDAAEPLQDRHALVIGHDGLDVLCGLIARGCGAAAELQPNGRVPNEPAEIVLATHVDSLDAAAHAIMMARRSLLPCGRIVLQETTGAPAGAVARMLREAGFCSVRLRASPEGTMVTADWPMFWPRMREAGHA